MKLKPTRSFPPPPRDAYRDLPAYQAVQGPCFEAYTAHLDECRPCRSGAGFCPAGARLLSAFAAELTAKRTRRQEAHDPSTETTLHPARRRRAGAAA